MASNTKKKFKLDQIHLGDTLEHLKTLPDECLDLVVSSPPYNIGKEYEARKAAAEAIRRIGYQRKYRIEG